MSQNSVRRKTAHMIRLLMDGAYTFTDIAVKTGMDYETVRPFVKDLHAAGVVHIAGYHRSGVYGRPAALYALGPGVDAPYPAPKRARPMKTGWGSARAERPLKKPPEKVAAPSSVFDLGRHLGVAS